MRWLPRSVRKNSARVLSLIPPARWSGTGVIPTFLRRRTGLRNLADKASKLAEILSCSSPDEMYRQMVSHWKHPETLVLGGSEPLTSLTDRTRWPRLSDFTQRMMFHDLVTYLPDDILVKVDRASMGVSLEAREPLLDHRLIEFAWKLPLSMKVRNAEGKWLLRKVLYRHVPREILDRPKMGFGIPIDSWLRGPLRDWAESLLDESLLRQEGFLDPAPIRAKWSEHLAGTRNWQYALWDVLMFQAWLRESVPAVQSSMPPREVSATVS
jgi:asparagine synthase (glutamine-hydrolysing)